MEVRKQAVRGGVVWLATCVLCACSGTPSAASSAQRGARGAPDAGALDSDMDGLCDSTEEDLGTDPHAADTDGDGLPDLIEVGNAFDPTDPSSPAPDQLGYLQAQPDAVLDFPVRLTVTGDGQGLSGVFESISSIYADGGSAADYFVGAQAVSADPAGGVRTIDTTSAHFESVLGRARLAFSLRFQYPADGKTRTCARAYPYRYSVKADDSSTPAQRLELLLLTPDAQTGHNVKYCLPRTCQ
ncbi:MAG: hypothetical protein ACHQ53_00365 [Polyangiales bacterium]